MSTEIAQIPSVDPNPPEEVLPFSFGLNWQRFLNKLNGDRLRRAEQSLVGFLGLPDLRGKTFIDIGCGSGLFSYAAIRLGAARVLSFDVDPASVACCRVLWNKAQRPSHWEIQRASILDENFLRQLGTFDIVYAWGVLHHTGNLWAALQNAAGLVAPGGSLYFSAYNRMGGLLGSDFWKAVKLSYVSSPRVVRRAFEEIAVVVWGLWTLAQLKNPLRLMRDHEATRGMSWKIDLRDWLGGYPYEYATVEEVRTFTERHLSSFRLARVRASGSLANNWYLLERWQA